jgi:TMEM175 potassium channel family protein
VEKLENYLGGLRRFLREFSPYRTRKPPGELCRVSTTRLEAFSDGVIAVAITLLVLNIELPQLNPGQSLASGLIGQWQVYVAYVVSFLTIGIIWINHHVMIGRLRETDRTILFLNLLLLMSIGLLPFATRLMAAYLKQSHGQHLATAIYSGSFLLMAVFFAALNRHILLSRPHLLRRELPLEQRRQILFRSIAGVVPYAIATALAAVSSYLTLGMCAALAIFYSLPIGSGGTEMPE